MARNRKFKVAQHVARLQGKEIGGIDSFVIPQDQVGVDNKYTYALRCYAKRGARDAFMAKVSLTAAWAMRVHLNRQLSDKDLAGGVKEVNDRINRHIDEDEEFDLEKWHKIYGDIFHNANLSNEGYFVVASSYLGLELRVGGHAKCDEILGKMSNRFADMKHGEKLRGITRERRRVLKEYRKFLSESTFSFAKAISKEEIRRSDLPTTMLAVAEGLRRSGSAEEAIDWYLAIANLDETEPELRETIRKEKRAPSPHASFYVHIGWKADLMIEKMTHGRVRELIIQGRDSFLLNAIVNEDLGTPEHKNPNWKPVTGGSIKELEFMINELGKSVIEYEFRLGKWPQSLGELWSVGVIPDWNRFNRFHCPVSGMPFMYTAQTKVRENIAKKTVLVRTSQAIATNQGPRYLNYLVNNTLVWTEAPVAVGQVVP
ncbi:MAG: hypothetical protein HRU15_15140 [Planctomycetes bacterium]|nr:hypothetical protein [Planctomycetota bacterium]